MSKYIKTTPLSEIERIAIVTNRGPMGKWLTLEQAMRAQAVEPDVGINGGYYNGDGSPAAHLKADGVVLAAERDSGDWGYAWDAGADIRMIQVPQGGMTAYRNHITCKALLTPWDGIDVPMAVGPALQGRRGWQAVGLDGEHLVIRSSNDGADGITLLQLREAMCELGCETAMALDSGQSVMYRTKGGGVYLYDRTRPKVQNYIFIWLKQESQKEDKPMSKKVCLDPGHGPGCVNGSPDGSYKEYEFAWDMARRCRAILERHGVTVVMTKDEKGYPSLTERCNVSNKAGVDLFVSLHSNASGDGKSWTSPSGFIIYTSAGPEAAARNVAARAVLKRAKEAGISICGGGLEHNMEYAVLKGTTAPAMIIEHGFHTNREDTALLKTDAYRAKLAEANCKGILDFLGVVWKDEKPAGTTDTPAAEWAAEAWRKAKDKGIMDGTRPTEAVTRQELAVVLDRLGLLG